MDRGDSYRGSYRIVHRDGTVHWIDDQAVVLHGENGQPDVIQGVAIDVTASKEAELALRWSERQLREMVAGLRLIAVFTDMDGRITDVNPEFERVTGWRREEVAGRMWIDVCVPPDEPAQHRRFQAALAAGRPITHLDAPLLLRDGSRRLISWNCSSLFDGAGRPSGTAGIGEDITDRAAAERAVRESEERYRGLAEHNVAGVWQTDAADRLVYANPALCRMLGVAGPDQLLGRPLVVVPGGRRARAGRAARPSCCGRTASGARRSCPRCRCAAATASRRARWARWSTSATCATPRRRCARASRAASGCWASCCAPSRRSGRGSPPSCTTTRCR